MKKYILSLAALSLIVTGVVAYRWFNVAATTTSSVQVETTTTDVLSSETALKDWQTPYFLTKQPASLSVRSSSENPKGPVYGSYLLGGTSTMQSVQLAVTVAALGRNTLAEISGVKVRSTQPTIYAPDQRSYVPTDALVFSRQDAYETAVFWSAGTKYVSVVVSGPVQHKAELEQALQVVVSNWQLLQ